MQYAMAVAARPESPSEGVPQAREEPRPGLRIVPEPSPEFRAFAEQQLFGHIDGAPDWFAAFLAEPELDNLATRHIAADLDTAQDARVRAVLVSGTPRQARFNLLMHPQLIPTDVRLAALRAAVRQSDDPYMRIAAIVGLQDEALRVPETEWPAVRDELLDATRDPRGVIRNRATVTLTGRLQADDVPAVVARIREGGLEGSELDNLVATFVKLGADDAVLEVLPIVLEHGAQVEATRAWLEAWQAAGQRPAEPAPPWFGMPALGYIPNLDG